MRSSLPRATTFLFLSLFLLIPLAASAECSDHEITAVMIVGNVYPGDYQTVETLSVYPVGEHTSPSHAELQSIIADHVDCDYFVTAWEGNYIHFLCRPNYDPQSSAIIDVRTGQLAFLGTESSSSVGQILIPEGPTHGWSMVEGAPAAEPTRSFLFRDSDLFPIIPTNVFIDQVMAQLLQTDVLHSFAQCGDYNVVIFPYTPTVNPVDPLVAKAVVMVTGSCGEPWNDQPVSVDYRTWGSVKSLYR
ncbi:MAG: hypothetical protein KAH56_02005 [Candidatus Krumholzibacteria bacterium]|nr:hypothetical protein [Candidatus Krumholzibacteria bacterium]